MPKIQTNNTELFYTERGQGEPLLLLMGLGADGSVWEEHVKAYEKQYRCILVDNRGAGQSSKPSGPYTTKMMAEDTAGLMQELGIVKAHISGISMGSAIAQELALAYPQLIQSLSLHCSWSKCDVFTTRIFEIFRSMIATADPIAFNRLLQLIIFTPQYHEEHLLDLLTREEMGKHNPFPMPIYAFQAQCDACITHDTLGRLHDIKAPTLITVGSKDIFTPQHHAQSIAHEIQHSELIIFEGSGHTHHWDSLSEFNAVTLDFMGRNSLS